MGKFTIALIVSTLMVIANCCARAQEPPAAPPTQEEVKELRNHIGAVKHELDRLDGYLEALTWEEIRGANVTDEMRDEWFEDAKDSFLELMEEMAEALDSLIDAGIAPPGMEMPPLPPQ